MGTFSDALRRIADGDPLGHDAVWQARHPAHSRVQLLTVPAANSDGEIPLTVPDPDNEGQSLPYPFYVPLAELKLESSIESDSDFDQALVRCLFAAMGHASELVGYPITVDGVVDWYEDFADEDGYGSRLVLSELASLPANGIESVEVGYLNASNAETALLQADHPWVLDRNLRMLGGAVRAAVVFSDKPGVTVDKRIQNPVYVKYRVGSTLSPAGDAAARQAVKMMAVDLLDRGGPDEAPQMPVYHRARRLLEPYRQTIDNAPFVGHGGREGQPFWQYGT